MEMDFNLKVTVAELIEKGVWEEVRKIKNLTGFYDPEDEVSLSGEEIVKYGLGGNDNWR